MLKPLYVFDMDDTLVNGDCSMLWNVFLVEKGIIKDPNFIEKDRAMMLEYAQGEMNMEEYLTFSLAPIMDVSATQIDELVDEFVTKSILPNVFSEAKTLIFQLKENEVPLLIISATVSFIVKKVAKQLGIEHAIGIDLLMKNNCYSSQVDGVASYREGKVQRLKKWIEINTIEFQSIHFYTDSINDLPLCLYADHTYLINPCEQLIEQKKNHDHWQVYKWGK
ncbi:HAD family hydrolase [Psychromonas sp. RZ22]|uniref:HAD family hydrolase n=1 Tax=Psychromonas algarum TaxID=2555643 RepID=UPI0010681D3F|nr:HAD family hydrolase [Psychromonas sp. RZ22]TEW55324.1 HAD family hydrolase [Psychromonas sp. RZ22]